MPQSFSHHDYDIIKREILYQGIFRLVRYQLRYRTFDGNWSNLCIREVLERQSAVAVLPYDPLLDRVVLIEQFRPGALHKTTSPWLLEIVAGVYDADETPVDVAKREALEEANCTLTDLYPICDFFVSPGGTNEYLHLFCGRIDASTIGGVHGLVDENEDIRAFTLPTDDAFAWIQQGKIKTSPAIITLQWLQLNRERLKALWQTK